MSNVVTTPTPRRGRPKVDEDEPITEEVDDGELITVVEAGRILGGKQKPLNRATIYRNLERLGLKIVHPTPGASRLSLKQVLKARARAIASE
jgi:hypothetical protein